MFGPPVVLNNIQLCVQRIRLYWIISSAIAALWTEFPKSKFCYVQWQNIVLVSLTYWVTEIGLYPTKWRTILVMYRMLVQELGAFGYPSRWMKYEGSKEESHSVRAWSVTLGAGMMLDIECMNEWNCTKQMKCIVRIPGHWALRLMRSLFICS